MKGVRKNVTHSLGIRLLITIILVTTFWGEYAPIKTHAASNTVKLSADYLNKEKCWIEAGRVSDRLGLSRERIAVEIYAHALVDNLSYRTLTSKLGSVKLIDYISKELIKHAHVANIGGDPGWVVSLYYSTWKSVESSHNNTYYIHSKLNTRQVIDVSGNSNKNGAKIQLYKQNNSSAQQFELFWTGSGNWYNLIKKGTFKALDVAGGVSRSQVKVQLYDYNGTYAQQWRMVSDGNDYCYLQNRLGYYLDAQGGNSANGTQIWTYTWNKSNAQKWYIKHW